MIHLDFFLFFCFFIGSLRPARIFFAAHVKNKYMSIITAYQYIAAATKLIGRSHVRVGPFKPDRIHNSPATASDL